MADEPTVVVGLVTKAHGLNGEVSVQLRSDNPDRWQPGAIIYLNGKPLTVEGVRGRSGDRVLVRFAGVADRTAADTLRGEAVVPESWLPILPPGQWWPHQIEGCLVVTAAGRELGRVSEVIPNPANDLWVTVADDGTETLVPALRDVLIDVDVGARRIRVEDVPGLTAPD